MVSEIDAPLLTVGHSNRTWPEFLRVLEAASIRTIFDVRRYPVSRRHPHFSKDEMKPALAAAGIGYRHYPELGGYRDDAVASAISRNTAWPAGFLRNYADYALTAPFQRALARLFGEWTPGGAVMCAEKNWRDCHRQIITDYALAAGYRVVHVVDERAREDAAMNVRAIVQPDAGIVYTAAQPPQLGFSFD